MKSSKTFKDTIYDRKPLRNLYIVLFQALFQEDFQKDVVKFDGVIDDIEVHRLRKVQDLGGTYDECRHVLGCRGRKAMRETEAVLRGPKIDGNTVHPHCQRRSFRVPDVPQRL